MKLLLVLTFGAVLSPASAALAGQGGQLVMTTGAVWVQPPQGSESPATPGVHVAPGSRIRTGSDGVAEVVFDDGSLLRVQADSSVRLSGFKRARSTKSSIVLFFGRVWSKVTHAISGDRASYEVSTPNAVCGVRGTEFETAVGDDGSVRVRVTAGRVAVGNEQGEEMVDPGEEVEADEEGIDEAGEAEERAKWEAWQQRKRERLRTHGRDIVDIVKGKILSRKEELESLRSRQEEIEAARKQAEARVRTGDASAAAQIRAYNEELAAIADEIADLGDEADSQFGIVDHYADLAADPHFAMIDRKYLISEAESLRRVRATFDAMVVEGTDISVEAMDKMLEEMGNGQRGSLEDTKGSSADDLFGPDQKDHHGSSAGDHLGPDQRDHHGSSGDDLLGPDQKDHHGSSAKDLFGGDDEMK